MQRRHPLLTLLPNRLTAVRASNSWRCNGAIPSRSCAAQYDIGSRRASVDAACAQSPLTVMRIAMTAPVTQEVAGSQQIAMTAPVVQQAADRPGSYLVRFVMPAGLTAQTLPAPTDARIHTRQIPEELAAAVWFSGRWTRTAFGERGPR